MPRLQLLTLLAVAIATAAHAQGVTAPYLAELKRQCPAQRLENMTAGDLELLMEDFQRRLTPAQVRSQQDEVGRRCARIEAGLSCGNAATLDAYRRFGLMRDFVHEACASGWRCTGFAECAQTQP
jgi:hypothetical protein